MPLGTGLTRCTARDLPGRAKEPLEGPFVTASDALDVNQYVFSPRTHLVGVPVLLALRAGESIRTALCFAHADRRALSAPPIDVIER